MSERVGVVKMKGNPVTLVGDEIKVGSNSLVMITDINYTTNNITVNESITWSDNDTVSLDYKGSAPDIGAFESDYTADTTAPSVYLVSPVGSVSLSDSTPISSGGTLFLCHCLRVVASAFCFREFKL